MKKKSSIKYVRKIVQLLFFLMVLLVVISHSLEEAGITIAFLEGASLHAICPFGGVVTIYQYVTSGTFVQKIHEASFYLMIIVFITAIIAGPIFCGWVCPFGTFQEWIGLLGKKLFKKKYNKFIPKKIDSVLRYLRYFVLIWVIVMTAVSATLIFSTYDPYYALFNFWTGEVAITGFISLGIVIILSLFVERPFCKYACPYGALLGITNLFRIFSIRRNNETCIFCKACDKACPMNIEISNKSIIRNHQCISCLACTSEQACPVEATLELNIKEPKKKEHKSIWNLDSFKVAIILIVIVLGGILILKAEGLWKTESSKVPIKIEAGEFAGMADPSDIRGSYTFNDIETNFKVPADILAQAFALDTSEIAAGDYKAKDLELVYEALADDMEGEVGTDSVRLFVSLYLGMPYEAEVTTLLPNPALNILKDKNLISEDKFLILKERSVAPSTYGVTEPTVVEEEHLDSANLVDMEIKGNTTFNDLLDWGLTKEQIEEILGYPINETSQTVRDFTVEKEIEFSDYRTEFQKLLDSL